MAGQQADQNMDKIRKYGERLIRDSEAQYGRWLKQKPDMKPPTSLTNSKKKSA